ncbi:hypothetical protein ES705_22527 [subsurface metagenome]
MINLEKLPFKPPKDYSVNELKERLQFLYKKGRIKIKGKKRSAAVGETIEYLLGLKKNSSKDADWGEYELKSTIGLSSRKIRLFSFRWSYTEDYSARDFTLKFGKQHHSKHLNLPVVRFDKRINYSNKSVNDTYYRINRNGNILELLFEDEVIATSDLLGIESHFQRKIRNLVLIKNRWCDKKKKDEFQVTNVKLLEIASFSKFLEKLQQNLIGLEFSLMVINPETEQERFNNRGSLFRASYKELSELYEKVSLLI